MRRAIRCCISCIIPCGALDVVRIVHADGHVEEICHAVRAADIMQAHPKHVLRKPPSASSFEKAGGGAQKAVILHPTAELKKGKIYFLMPISSAASDKARAEAAGEARRRKKKREGEGKSGGSADTASLLVTAGYSLTTEKVSTRRERRTGRVGVWRPHLESISEASSSDI